MKNLLLLLVLGLIAGCTSVASVNPVGTEVVELDSEAWNGVWSDGKEAIYFIKVKDKGKGILHIGIVEENDGKFMLNTFDAEIKSINKDKFCNIKIEGILKAKEIKDYSEKLKKSYYWMLVNNTKGEITIIIPNAENIEKLAKESNLKALKEKDTILLESSGEEITKFIQSYKNGELYMWKNPMILKRIMKK